MPKTIESPVARWPGTVTLTDPLDFEQFYAWQDRYLEAEKLFDVVEQDGKRIPIPREGKDFGRIYYTMLPVMLQIVQEWNLEGFPEKPTTKSFPASPNSVRRDSHHLMAWLFSEIGQLYRDADEAPNE